MSVRGLWTPADLAREFHANEIDLFRFSAVTWNAHRIHYDRAQVQADGLPGLPVQAQLHGAWFAQVARALAGPSARLRTLAWSNRRPVVAGETVSIRGTVEHVDAQAHTTTVTVELTEHNQAGELCGEAQATVRVPSETRA
jgi:hydroxyacyl-ACP dehydratase HTD2-like protein with hotdog domain